jgi:hypothetical protein
LKQRQRGREVKELTLTEHECELIKDVVSPSEIDVDFNSIGSLEDIKSTGSSACRVSCV